MKEKTYTLLHGKMWNVNWMCQTLNSTNSLHGHWLWPCMVAWKRLDSYVTKEKTDLQIFLYVQSYVRKFIQQCRASPVTDETSCSLKSIMLFLLFYLRIYILKINRFLWWYNSPVFNILSLSLYPASFERAKCSACTLLSWESLKFRMKDHCVNLEQYIQSREPTPLLFQKDTTFFTVKTCLGS